MRGVDEGDLLAATTAAAVCRSTNSASSLLEVGQGGGDIGDGEGDVVQTLATPLEETADRSVGTERLRAAG